MTTRTTKRSKNSGGYQYAGGRAGVVTEALRQVKAVSSVIGGQKARVERVEVTPAIAGDWLAANQMNRRLRDGVTLRLAHEIKEGRWADYNGETIKFAADGTLLDGQHRLTAVIVADRPIGTYVAYGVEKDAFATFDTGLKRSGRDALFVQGESDVRELSAAVHAMYRWLTTGTFLYKNTPSNLQLLETLQATPGLRESTIVAKQVKRKLPGASWGVIAVMHYLCKEVDEADTADFFEALTSGAGLMQDNPLYLFRERLIRSTVVSTGQTLFNAAHEQGVLLGKTWNAWRQDETWTPKQLRFHENEGVPRLV